MTTQDVRKAIIEPMTVTFAPPKHLRYDPELQERAIREYELTLKEFDRDLLDQAWRFICKTHVYNVWPAPAVIVQTVMNLQGKRDIGPTLEEKQAKAQSLVDAYVKHYGSTSQLAKQAKRDGWIAPLRQYVSASAWVQAQLLVGMKGIGYDSILLRHADPDLTSQQAISQFIESVRPAVEEGKIKVTVPTVLVKEWKQIALSASQAIG